MQGVSTRVVPAASLVAAVALAGCAARVPPVAPPPVVATLAPPPPVMPAGGYVGMEIPSKREDGTYVTPNFQMTDAAAVWHLRGVLNVAALACDNTAGGAGGVTVAGYNSWITAHREVLAAHNRQYLAEWEETGWGDWQAAYDNAQTRLYNFYGQPAIRIAFCAVAASEVAAVAAVADAELPAHARAALARLDRPFLDFYKSYDAWRDYYQPKVAAPPAPRPLAEIPAAAAPVLAPPVVPTTDDVASGTVDAP